MKSTHKFITIIILSFILTSGLYPQVFDWEWQNPLPTGADHNDAAVLSLSKSILVGNGSAVTLSTDSGLSWSVSYPDQQARDIYSITFIDQNIGYIAGTGGLIMKSTDGGTNWIEQNSGVTTTLWDVEFVNSDTGFVAGASGTILYTNNGGINWTQSNLGTTTIYKVHFINESIGFLGSASATTGRLLKTTNGGTSWENITANITGLDGTVRGIHFSDLNTGWISNSTGKIYKTTDGGSSGSIVYDIGSTTANIYEVKFIDAVTGFAISSAGRILKTTDGGTNWGLTQTSATKNLFGLGILNVLSEGNTPILIGGDIGTILYSSDLGTSWQARHSAVTQEQLLRVSFPSENTGYVVGGSITTGNQFGDILKTTDAGLTWTKLPFNPGYRTYSVYFRTDDEGYVGVQGPNGLYKTTDGGQNWTPLNTGTGVSTSIIYDIKFYNADLGFAMYASGQVARTTNGGQSWTPVSAGWGSAAGYDIFIVDSLTIYICGAGGRISKSTNAGVSFLQLPTLGTATLYSMHFHDASNGFVSASGGRIFKTTDGGNNFSELTLPVTSTIYVIRFINQSLGWFGASGGDVYYTTDGGANWTESHISIGGSQSIRDIRFAGSRMFLIGTDGLIMRGYSDPSVPVELISFSGYTTGNKIILSWITAGELNNHGFEIERKNNSAGWNTLDFISGNGTTSNTSYYTYNDMNPVIGLNQYRLKQIDYDGNNKFLKTIEIDHKNFLNYSLEQNYPNPFNPSTNIDWQIPERSFVTIKIFNSLGEEITTILNDFKDAGSHSTKFNLPPEMPSGVYFYKLTAGSFKQIKKMLFLK